MSVAFYTSGNVLDFCSGVDVFNKSGKAQIRKQSIWKHSKKTVQSFIVFSWNHERLQIPLHVTYNVVATWSYIYLYWCSFLLSRSQVRSYSEGYCSNYMTSNSFNIAAELPYWHNWCYHMPFYCMIDSVSLQSYSFQSILLIVTKTTCQFVSLVDLVKSQMIWYFLMIIV